MNVNGMVYTSDWVLLPERLLSPVRVVSSRPLCCVVFRHSLFSVQGVLKEDQEPPNGASRTVSKLCQ